MLKFMRYAQYQAFIAAQKSRMGICFVTQKEINKLLSYSNCLGRIENKMMDYLRGKHHALAMKNFKSIGTGSVYGYEGRSNADLGKMQ